MKMSKFVIIVCMLAGATTLLASEFKNNLAVGFHMNVQKLFGDQRTGPFEYGWNPISFRYNFRWHAYLESDVGFSQLSIAGPSGTLNTDLLNLGLKLGYRFRSEERLNPLVYFGLGMFNFKTGNGSRFWDGYGAVGGGVEMFLTDYLGLNLTTDLRYTTGDALDAQSSSAPKDAFVNLGLGMNYYFGGRGEHVDGSPEFLQEEAELSAHVEELAEQKPPESDSLDTAPVTAHYNQLAEIKQDLMKSLADKELLIRFLNAKIKAFEERRMQLDRQAGYDVQRDPRSKLSARQQQFQKRLQAALDYFAYEKYEDAILSLKSILYEEPDGPLAPTCWYWLGECHFNREEYHAAIESFEITALHAPAGSPRGETARIMLALSHWKLGEFSSAKSGLKDVLANIIHRDYGPIIHELLVEIDRSQQVQSTN